MARVAAHRPSTAPDLTVERKIYFYSIYAGHKNGEPVEFDPAPIVHHINDLPFTMEGRYLDVGEGNVTFVLPNAIEDARIPVETGRPSRQLCHACVANGYCFDDR